jgi:hypothetical protein
MSLRFEAGWLLLAASTCRMSSALPVLQQIDLPQTGPLQTELPQTEPNATPVRARGDQDTRAEIHASELAAHVEYLAADELGGRATGSPGGRLAATYLAQQLERAGVKPGGDGGSYWQDARLVRRAWRAAPQLEFETADGTRIAAEWGTDYEIENAHAFEGRIELCVGSMPGAILPSPQPLLPSQLSPSPPPSPPLSGAEPAEPQPAGTQPASSSTPSDAAKSSERPTDAAHAGLGVIWDGGTRSQRDAWLEAQGRSAGRGLSALVLTGSRKPGKPRTELPVLGISTASSIEEPFSVRLRGELAGRAAAGEFRALVAQLDLSSETGGASNVVGRLPARGARTLPGALVISAHYDHLGARDPRPTSASAPATNAESAPDRIYNGADDDASGCAAVLELAEAWAAQAERAHEVVFLLATGEEVGLLGTEYYIQHPVVPLAETLVNLNFEMIGRADAKAGGSGVLWLTGFERSNLGAAWQAAGLPIVPDPYPEQNFFTRSDNIAFARRGIVAQTLSSYDLHADYHKPSDEWNTLDYAHMERALRASQLAFAPLLDGTLAPSWLPGGDPSKATRPKGGGAGTGAPNESRPAVPSKPVGGGS